HAAKHARGGARLVGYAAGAAALLLIDFILDRPTDQQHDLIEIAQQFPIHFVQRLALDADVGVWEEIKRWLRHALVEVERQTGLRFRLEDPALGELRIGGHFRATDADAFLSLLESNFALHIARDGDTVTLSRATPQ